MGTKIDSLMWLKLAISFKYISNISIIIAVLAYYMNAMPVFFILAPMIITNSIVLPITQIYEGDKLVTGMLSEYIPDAVERAQYKTQLIVLTNLWHFIGLIWLYNVMTRGIIQVYSPNFMGIFFMSSVLVLFYFMILMKKKPYGDIDYMTYLLIYMIVNFAMCVLLFLSN